jgi:hypothetical protein
MNEARVLNVEAQEKTVMDYMELCLAYDMAFDFDTKSGVMDIAYHTIYDDYAQLYFSEEGQFEQAFMEYSDDVHEYGAQDSYFGILELIRLDIMHQIYLDHGLIEHPRNKYRRRGDYSGVLECLKLAVNKRCVIDYYGNIVKIESTSSKQPSCTIVISMQRGQYMTGMYRRRGVTIDVPDLREMQKILENLKH